MTKELSMVLTSAGRGTRLRPLSLYSPTTMIPKGLMRVMGIPLAEIQLELAKSLGIKKAYIIAQHLENREQLANRFGNGKMFGLNLQYSHPVHDHKNNGSGDAILRNIQEYDLKGNSIILPNDNLFEADFKKALKKHEKSEAIVTILTIPMKPRDTINTYGLIDIFPDNCVKKLLEKPKDEKEVMKALGYSNKKELDKKRVHVNTAGYIINNDKIKKLLSKKWIIDGRNSKKGFDMAGDLLTGLIEDGKKICVFPVNGWGDFGSPTLYIETIKQVLNREFPFLNKLLKEKNYISLGENVYMHPGAIKGITRKNQIEKFLKENKIKLGPNVFIGRGCDLRYKCELSYCNIEKQVSVGVGAKIKNSFISPYSWIGYGAVIEDSVLSLQASVESSIKKTSEIINNSVIGPQIIIPEGSKINNGTIFPGCFFKRQVNLKNKIHKPEREELIKFYRTFE